MLEGMPIGPHPDHLRHRQWQDRGVTHDSSDRWEVSFANGKKAALSAIMQGDTAKVLSIVFDRLYVLRNQLIHGGATWNGIVNRAQLQDCVNLMGKLVPVVIEIMLNSSDTIWGDACYPVINS